MTIKSDMVPNSLEAPEVQVQVQVQARLWEEVFEGHFGFEAAFQLKSFEVQSYHRPLTG